MTASPAAIESSPMNFIDLRSDTVTWPTDKMRRAMAEARVGDDVFGDDPTVLDLEARAAKRFGKEAAVFVPTGTMGNVLAILAQCGRGERAIMGDRTHTFGSEGGNPATVGSVQAWPAPVQPDGTIRIVDLRAGVSPTNDYHFPLARLIAIENTQAGVGGQPVPLEYIREVKALCREHELKLHIDGARIFNAAAALGVDARALTADSDTVMFCLSKGLCAPIGSLVVGTAAFADRARRIRKSLGGGMRQVGIIAAAGMIALEDMTERLHEDHATARALAEGLGRTRVFDVDLPRVRTNMFFCTMSADALIGPAELTARLRADGILVWHRGNTFRFVTHYWITAEHIEQVLARIRHHLS